MGLSRLKKILFIGNGAREHAMVENLSRDSEIYTFATAKNPGIFKLSKDYLIAKQDDYKALKEFVEKNNPDFCVVGPEAPLSNGVVDFLDELGVKSFGPTKEHSKLETSKSWTRNLMEKYDIPGLPKFKTFNSTEGLKEFLEELNKLGGFVVKPDGLTGGKGVKISDEHLKSIDEGISYCEEVLKTHPAVVIEEKFVGEEFSLIAVTDGITILECQPIQDHKRAFNGDTGPNTGGMGSYSTCHLLPFMKASDITQAHLITTKMADSIFKETGSLYVGVMYGGFIATKEGVKLIEYNARFGDPEAMNIFPLMKTNFSKVCEAAINKTLNEIKIEFKDESSVCKYIVPEGYPDNPQEGGTLDISSVDTSTVKLYYASVDEKEEGITLSKSRSIAVVGIHKDIAIAEKNAQEACASIKGSIRYRTDIGKKELLDKRVFHMKSLGRVF